MNLIIMNLIMINLRLINLLMNLKLKFYFNSNKALIVYVNHALLGFYSCQSRKHKYYGFNGVQLKVYHTL